MSSSRKAVSSISKELQRHVQSGQRSRASSKTIRQQRDSAGDGSGGSGISNTLLGCVAFVGVTASIPFLSMHWIGPLNEREEALTHAQVRRGAFNNSGSRDIGKDPKWDFKTGTRVKDEGYRDLFLKDKPNEVDHSDGFLIDAKSQSMRSKR